MVAYKAMTPQYGSTVVEVVGVRVDRNGDL